MSAKDKKKLHLIDESGEGSKAVALLREQGYQVEVSTSTKTYLKFINKKLVEYITNQGDYDCSDHVINFTALTKREKEVVEHLVLGAGESTNKAIAKVMNISHRTVEEHRASAMRKMNTNSLKELFTIVIRCNLYGIKTE